MIGESEINAILARRKEISDEIERLQTEDKELEIAIRILRRYESLAATNGAGPAPILGPPRPEGTPTLFEMTVEVLREAIADGKPGLTGQEIVAAIGEKYWPGLQGRQVFPPIYGFVKNKRLQKSKDGVFKPL